MENSLDTCARRHRLAFQPVVAGNPFSHYHRNSAWQRAELRRVYGDTGMTEMDWATGADGYTGATEMDGATGSIYSGDPWVDRLSSQHLISSHLISSYNELHTLLFPAFVLTRSVRDPVDPRNCVNPHGRVVSHLLTLFLRASSQNRSLSRIPFGMPQDVRQSVDDGLSAF